MMLTLQHLTAGYHKTAVITDINASFKEGRITAVIGPNGCGKSTLMKAAVALCGVYEGTVFLGETAKEQMGHRAFSRHVSYLPQSHSGGAITVARMVLHGRFPHLTSYPRRYRRSDYELCHQAMERTGILPIQDRPVEELSGGQRQMVYLAMALAGEMDVYLLDEPTTYLDVNYQLELLAMLGQLREQGKTVVVVIHDLNCALQTADEIIVMDKGRIIFTGTPSEVIKSQIIDQIFQVRSKIVTEASGKQYVYFERK